MSGQRNLTYTATDSANTANIATVGLLVTATDVDIKPLQGRPNRRLTITGRGFFGGGKRLWAHIKRGRGAARNVRLGRIKGACKKTRSRKRLFAAGAAPGVYYVQFDAFRRFRRNRVAKSPFSVTISGTAGGGGGGLGLAPARLRLSRPRPRAARTGPRRHGGAP